MSQNPLPAAACGGVSSAEIEEFSSRLALLDGVGDDIDDRERIRLIEVMESAKAALCAAQARVSVAFDASQREAQRAAGVPAAKVGAGVAEQIALARHESPTHGSRHLGLAKALVHELPHTMAAMTAGELSEWRATLIAQATAVLTMDDRAEVDRRLAGRVQGLSDRQVRAAALAAAYELDPRSIVDRAAYAVKQRRVTMRPAPDTMAYLTALLPAAQAVAVFAALHAAAGSARASGDERSADQVKADTLVERVTGQATASAVPIEVGLVMSDATLLSADQSPAMLLGYGPIPAPIARSLAAGRVLKSVGDAVAGSTDPAQHPALPSPTSNVANEHVSVSRDQVGDSTDHVGSALRAVPALAAARLGPPRAADPEGDALYARLWLRRFYLDPDTGSIRDADRHRRLFPAHLRRVVVARDQWCRTPWCGAPIRHIDHATAWRAGGLTSLDNAAGLCERCNHAKESPGWATSVASSPGEPMVITTVTPTGATHQTVAPTWVDHSDPDMSVARSA
ncbi:MAG: DUF222 domain-containing protein [Actinomycetales bacterium]|nr:DUF222 domain-containing protein [Actinomycetales bacterium]